MTCTVEFFGVARMIAGTRELTLTLPFDATIAQVLDALSERLPVLAGRVIGAPGAGLLDGYACNLNGLEFVRNTASRVTHGDRIVLLSADAGG